MKGARYLIFGAVVACAYCSAFSQNSPSCQADLQDLKLPSRAFIDGAMGENEPPVSLLFSQGGVDAYAATDYEAIKALRDNGISSTDEAVTVIVVFQDEQVRSSIAKLLEDGGVSPENAQKVKFKVFQFMLTPIWVDNVLERKWMISGYEYYEPYSCVPPSQRRESQAQYDSELCAATDYCPNQIYGIFPLSGLPARMRLVPEDSNVLKALEMIRSKLAAYGLPN